MSYDLIAELARGGVGTVYLCRKAGRAGFKRLFALKLLHDHLASEEVFVSMLLEEGRIAAQLHHPNVVSILDLGRSDRGYYLVMEYVEGCSFAELLDRSPDERPPGRIAAVVLDALAGLQAAHALCDEDGAPLGLVHRDISPQNILLGVDGRARIADFGIAKVIVHTSVTQPGMRKGKLLYMAPEQLMRHDELDQRADIFSMGAVLWNALTGKKLFDADTEAGIIYKLTQGVVPKPSTMGLRPPECFDEVCLRALALDPADRYQSADEMAAALRHAATGDHAVAAASDVSRWVREEYAGELGRRREIVRQFGNKARRAHGSQAGLRMPQITSSFPMVRAEGEGSVTGVRPKGRRRAATVSAWGRRASRKRLVAGAISAVVGAAAVFLAWSMSGSDDSPARNTVNAAPRPVVMQRPAPASDEEVAADAADAADGANAAEEEVAAPAADPATREERAESEPEAESSPAAAAEAAPVLEPAAPRPRRRAARSARRFRTKSTASPRPEGTLRGTSPERGDPPSGREDGAARPNAVGANPGTDVEMNPYTRGD